MSNEVFDPYSEAKWEADYTIWRADCAVYSAGISKHPYLKYLGERLEQDIANPQLAAKIHMSVRKLMASLCGKKR